MRLPENPKHDYEFINIALMPSDRKALHDKIEKRFQQMLDNGFIDEVKRLFYGGDLHMDLPAIKTVGYRQVWEYLLENYSYEEMQAKAVAATRQLAKRQYTWLRSWDNLMSFDSLSVDDAVQKMRIA